MRNPAFWARLGLLWCLFIFAACWCASSKASVTDATNAPDTSARAATMATVVPPSVVSTRFAVANSRAGADIAVDGSVVHPLPVLDGFGLFILAAALGLAAFWLWRRRQ